MLQGAAGLAQAVGAGVPPGPVRQERRGGLRLLPRPQLPRPPPAGGQDMETRRLTHRLNLPGIMHAKNIKTIFYCLVPALPGRGPPAEEHGAGVGGGGAVQADQPGHRHRHRPAPPRPQVRSLAQSSPSSSLVCIASIKNSNPRHFDRFGIEC